MRVVIWAPHHHREHWQAVLTAAAGDAGWDVVGFATGDWWAALADARRHGAVVLVARREHVPPGGIPGVRVLGEE